MWANSLPVTGAVVCGDSGSPERRKLVCLTICLISGSSHLRTWCTPQTHCIKRIFMLPDAFVLNRKDVFLAQEPGATLSHWFPDPRPS